MLTDCSRLRDKAAEGDLGIAESLTCGKCERGSGGRNQSAKSGVRIFEWWISQGGEIQKILTTRSPTNPASDVVTPHYANKTNPSEKAARDFLRIPGERPIRSRQNESVGRSVTLFWSDRKNVCSRWRACTATTPIPNCGSLLTLSTMFLADHQFETGPGFIHRADLHIDEDGLKCDFSNDIFRDIRPDSR